MMPVRCEKDGELWQAVAAAKDAQAGKYLLGEGLPSAAVIAVEHYEALRQAVDVKCKELVPRGRGGRTAPAYDTDGRCCSVILTRAHEDGTDSVWQVAAYAERFTPGKITVQVHGPWLDNHDAEWERRLRKDLSSTLIVDHRWYSIGPGGRGGFGGHRFRFRRLVDGSEVISNDMWFGGVIPPAWRERIPDTAVMLEGFHPGFTG